jgi:hypothetical protein
MPSIGFDGARTWPTSRAAAGAASRLLAERHVARAGACGAGLQQRFAEHGQASVPIAAPMRAIAVAEPAAST